MKNSHTIEVDHSMNSILLWIEAMIKWRLNAHFNNEQEPNHIGLIEGYGLKKEYHPLIDFIIKNQLNYEQQFILILALTPHIYPEFIESCIRQFLKQTGDFPQLGGVRGTNFRGFLPTGETALFILAGDNLEKRFEVQRLFASDHFFFKSQVLWLEEPPSGEPVMCGKMVLSQEYVELFTLGKISRPRFGINFPAQLLETLQEWDDLVLSADTMQQVRELELWLTYGNTLLQQWGMNKKTKPGYRVLFHGPPGTGKTLTASLLGKYTGKEVYKIDLSMVVSKFIGETEKNLANLFDKAESKDWILFFDEADALFGKRTSVRDAHDKYANQEVSFLLQRTENYNGLVILATNFKSNIDDAFSRRFQSHIYFPAPKYTERLQLWEKAIPDAAKLESRIDLSAIARQYELTGANIMNIVQYACLQTVARGEEIIKLNDLTEGIKKEYSKEGKII